MPQNKEKLAAIEELFGQYWDLAFTEGSTGANQSTAANDVLHNLRQLLDQPECEPVRYEYQAKSGLWFPFTNQHHHDNTVNDGTYPIRPLYTHPAPFTPITADMVTDEMVTLAMKLNNSGESPYSARHAIAAAVNAWGAKK
jgi:hypothetical protein